MQMSSASYFIELSSRAYHMKKPSSAKKADSVRLDLRFINNPP